MSGTMLLINLVIAIAVIIIGIVVFKLNPSVSLIIASLLMGVLSGYDLLKTSKIITEGFGSMMMSIGLPVGFGVILGQIMSETGCAHVIAEGILKVFKGKKSIFGIALAGLILTIPVFFDIAVIILMPIAMSIAKQIKKPLGLVTGFLVMGAALGQSLIPPTPNPLAAADIFGFDLGIMIGMGSVVAFITCILGCLLYNWLFNQKWFWNDAKDVNHDVAVSELVEQAELKISERRPNLFVAFLPIIVPVACILMGTLGGVLYGENIPMWMHFLGDKLIAMLLGALVSYFIGWKYLGKVDTDKAASVGLSTAGMVLLITGAGGSFGAIIKETDIGNALVSTLGINTGNSIALLLFAYGVGAVFRIAQGSGTVAGITSMQIMASMSHLFTIHPVYIAIACLAGGNSLGHVNDSGFWVSTNLSGLNLTGGLKTYTTGIFITTIFELALVIILSIILPLA